jgi:hypothetical protein
MDAKRDLENQALQTAIGYLSELIGLFVVMVER